MADLTSPYYAPAAAHFGYAGNQKVLDSKTVNVAATNLTLNSLMKLFQARKGFCVTGVFLIASDMDTNGTPLLTLALGDLSDDDRFVTASTIGRTGGNTSTLASTGLLYTFTADTDIYAKVTAAAATAAAGTIQALLIGYETKV